MLTRFAGTVLIATCALATSAVMGQAQTTSTGTDSAKAPAKASAIAKKPMAKVTCEEFNALDETFKPNLVAWAAGYQNGQTKPDVVEIDVEGVARVTPIVIDECRKAPTASFWSKVEAELKKL
ncbi:HdeA/HdeB family chaperone [Hansschlegelia beijingensis]|uniref:HdeA/HdeB family chaperone n=1 Tax=Hansschlegelia beijingensis TaxID=1133344 RepID=UPI00387EFEB9